MRFMYANHEVTTVDIIKEKGGDDQSAQITACGS